MKRIYLWIFLLFACGNVFAQNNMVQYEYWLDNAYASKAQTNISPTQTFSWRTTIPCQNLDVGFHVLNVRFKDSKGQWSSTVSSYFYKTPPPKDDNAIVAYEYWIDDQYAGSKKENAGASPVFNLSAAIPYNELNAGIHSFNIRFMDKYGQWSATESRYFQKLPDMSQNKMVAYEYWINDDYDGRQTGSINNLQSFVMLDNLDVSKAADGDNIIHFRFKDAMGNWSSVLSQVFHLDINGSAIKQISNNNTCLNVFPNPVENNAVVEFYLQQSKNVLLIISNIAGQKVKELYNGQAKTGINQVPFDVSKMDAGVYFITLQSVDSKETMKVVIK